MKACNLETSSCHDSREGGWGGSNSDYKAISVQLQLQLPAGTELGNTRKEVKLFPSPNFFPLFFL